MAEIVETFTEVIIPVIGVLMMLWSIYYASKTFRTQFEPRIIREFYWKSVDDLIYEARLVITNNTETQWDLSKVKFKPSSNTIKIYKPEDCYSRGDYGQLRAFDKEMMKNAKPTKVFGKIHRTIHAISQQGREGHPFDSVQGNRTTVYSVIDLTDCPNRSLMLSIELSLSSSDSIKKVRRFKTSKKITEHVKTQNIKT